MKHIHIFIIGFCAMAFQGLSQEPLKVMTYNIKYDNPKDSNHLWKDRLPIIVSMIQQKQPDIIGMQEVLDHQLQDLAKNLPGYAWVGVGRDDGKTKGEYVPVFYKKARLELRGTPEYRWISETPEVPGSISWESACTRMYSLVKLNDNIDGLTWVVLNTHLDHVSQKAREAGAAMIKDVIEFLPHPCLVMGDFNMQGKAVAFWWLEHLNRQMVTTSDVAEKTTFHPTFTGFSDDPQERKTIDYIFVTEPENKTVLSYHVLSDSLLYQASDHLPVLVELEMKP